MRAFGLAMILVAASVAACTEKADARSAQASATQVEGAPYVLRGTQVWTVPDPVSGRDYEVFVSLPASYETSPQRRYPVLYAPTPTMPFPSFARSRGA